MDKGVQDVIKDSRNEETLKRKTDTEFYNPDSPGSSDSEDKQQSKKLKIPIKLSLSSADKKPDAPKSVSTKEVKDNTSQLGESKPNKPTTTTNATKVDPAVPIVKQSPTGNLAPSNASKPLGVLKNVSEKVAKVFGSDDDDETEEMPFEARMKMRNIGRNTPTSTGPNSYGKTKTGFTDQRKLFEKQLKEKADDLLRQEMERKNNSKK